MEYAMTDEEIAQLKRLQTALALGWKSSTMKPEFRGPDFPGTEDYPNGWFRNGVLVTTDGTVHHSVEPHQVFEMSVQYIPAESVLPILQVQ